MDRSSEGITHMTPKILVISLLSAIYTSGWWVLATISPEHKVIIMLALLSVTVGSFWLILNAVTYFVFWLVDNWSAPFGYRRK